jgi:hypothetical protein
MFEYRAIMMWLNRFAFALLWIIFGLAGCAGPVHPTTLSVSPSYVIVDSGSTTTFTAVFTGGSPDAGSLTWSVTPTVGGTITGDGVYTASGTTGDCTIVATWTTSNRVLGGDFRGSATVEVLTLPQLDVTLNPGLVQASGAIQMFGAIQNAAIVGQLIPSVISTDTTTEIQVRSGFTPPVACKDSDTVCYWQELRMTPGGSK